MKKLLLILLCLASSAVLAETCPPSSLIFVHRDNGYDVAPPPGWKVTIDKRQSRHRNVYFRIAAWGDHKHPTDSVRCHYYDVAYSDHIQLETIDLVERSRLSSQWRGTEGDRLYAICGSNTDNVNECVFS